MTVYNGPSDGSGARRMHWTHWLTLIMGVLLFIAPWLLGYAGQNNSAYLASLVLGALIVIFSLIAMGTGAGSWAQWLTLILGVLAIIAPWVMGFTNLSNAFYACVVLGAITLIVSAIGLFSRPRVPAA